MADIDKLSIEVKASARSADKAIANLEKNVKALSGSLAKIKTGNIQALGQGISQMAKGMQGFKGVQAKKFDQVAEGIQKIANIDASNMRTLSSGLSTLAPALTSLNKVNPEGLTKTINAITRLTKASNGGINTSGLVRLGSAMSVVQTSLASAPTVARSTTTLVSGIARLASSGDKANAVANALPRLGTSLLVLTRNFAKAPTVAQETVQLVSAISQLANAGQKAALTAGNLRALGNATYSFIVQMSKAPQVSSNTTALVTAMGQLASAGRGASSMFNGLSRVMSNNSKSTGMLKKAFDGLRKSISHTNSSGKNFAQVAGMFYAKCFLVIRAFNKIKEAVSTAMDYIETYNYFQAAWKQVVSRADLSAWEELGYKSAEAYAESFRKNSETMIGKLSGFSIGSNGELTDTGANSLGIDPDMAMQYQALFSQMGSSMGVASEYANKLTNSLELIALDLASVKNMEFTDVLNDMQSGMVGMSRTVDKYGANIRVAAMDTYLAEHNINATANSLSQADKALLRTTMILDSSRYSWGDLANTINQPANQVRMLKNEIKSLGRTLGNLLMPMIAKILPYLNAFVIVVRRAFEALGQLLGIQFDTGSATPDNSAASDYLDTVEETDKAQKSAADSAKKWKNQLMGFDEINKLEANDDSDSGDDNKGKNASSGIGDLFNSIYDEYMKAWNKAYNNMTQDANNMAIKIQNAFKKAWKNSDGSEIGASIAGWLNKGLAKASNAVPKLNATMKKLATVVGTGINGFVKTFHWKTLGSTLGEAIKGAFESERTFFKTVNWYNLGKNISDTIMSFLDSGVMESFAKMWGTKIRSVISLAFGTIANFDFSKIGKHLGDSINAFFTEMNTVNDNTGLTGWQELGKTISKSVIGILDTVSTALDTVDWNGVGNAIAQFLNEVDWGTILTKTAQVFWKAFGGALESTASGSKELDFGNIAPLIATALGVKLGGKAMKGLLAPAGKNLLKNLLEVIKLNGPKFAKNLGTTIFNALKTGIRALPGLIPKLGSLIAKFASTLLGEITICLAVAFAGFKLGNWLYEKNFFNISDSIDKIVESSGLGDLATKIADFFQFEIPDNIFPKVKKWAQNLALDFASALPDWMKKLCGVTNDDILQLKTIVNADTTDAENKIDNLGKDKNGKTKTVSVNSKINKIDTTNLKVSDIKIGAKFTVNNKSFENLKDLTADIQAAFQSGKKTSYTYKDANGRAHTVYKADGGLFKNGSWEPIQKYAVGGSMPNQGQYFIAREAGPELVGTIGGHTSVMNNDQIVSSVSNGVAVAVANTVAPMISQVIGAINSNASGDTYIDGTLVTNAILQNAHNRKITNGGKNVFMTV